MEVLVELVCLVQVARQVPKVYKVLLETRVLQVSMVCQDGEEMLEQKDHQVHLECLELLVLADLLTFLAVLVIKATRENQALLDYLVAKVLKVLWVPTVNQASLENVEKWVCLVVQDVMGNLVLQVSMDVMVLKVNGAVQATLELLESEEMLVNQVAQESQAQ